MPSLAVGAECLEVPKVKAKRPRMLWKRMLILAPALRLGIAATTWSQESPQRFYGQASELGVLAESLRSGHGFVSPFGGGMEPTAFLTPGYPAIIACVFAVFHPYSLASQVAITMLQALFAAVTVVVLMLLTRRAFGERSAVIAGAVWAVSPTLLWLPTFFWETSLSILLLTGLLALAYRCKDRNDRGSWLLMGLVAAAAICVNPSLLTILGCCFGWALWRNRRETLVPAMLGVGLFVGLSLIWPVRNLAEMHAWIPLRSNMGYELWQGNRPGADGFFLVALHPNTSVVELHRWEELGEIGYMREKTELAKAAIKADPARFVRLTLKRFLCFWTGVSRVNSWLVISHIVTTTLFGLWGAGLMVWRRREDAALFVLPLVVFPLPYYVTHPDFRFRLVLEPVLIALGAYAVTQVQRRVPLPPPVNLPVTLAME